MFKTLPLQAAAHLIQVPAAEINWLPQAFDLRGCVKDFDPERGLQNPAQTVKKQIMFSFQAIPSCEKCFEHCAGGDPCIQKRGPQIQDFIRSRG